MLRGAFATLLDTAVSLQAPAADDQLPPERQAGVTSYVSGGIGEGEAHRFEAAARRLPLTIQVFEHAGARRPSCSRPTPVRRSSSTLMLH